MKDSQRGRVAYGHPYWVKNVRRIHDVSPLLEDNRERLPASIRDKVPELVRISRSLRRDRELAFYGSEDLTPSEFYHREDAENAFASARFVHAEVSKAMET